MYYETKNKKENSHIHYLHMNHMEFTDERKKRKEKKYLTGFQTNDTCFFHFYPISGFPETIAIYTQI